MQLFLAPHTFTLIYGMMCVGTVHTHKLGWQGFKDFQDVLYHSTSTYKPKQTVVYRLSIYCLACFFPVDNFPLPPSAAFLFVVVKDICGVWQVYVITSLLIWWVRARLIINCDSVCIVCLYEHAMYLERPHVAIY